MNSWKRNEALEVSSVGYLSKCEGTHQIEVVWCDEQGEPPEFLLANPKVVIEHHKLNSLNERFNVITEPETKGILSIDDDIIYPCCEALDNAFFWWVHSLDLMVTFQPRGVIWMGPPRRLAYLKDPANRNKGFGVYSLALTSAAFLHHDYMDYYMQDLKGIIINIVHVLTN
eukprot:scaffold129712_cov50-Attheya_sp.AAC.1